MPNLVDMALVLEKAGQKVAESAGWRTRGHGTFGKCQGILLHHTVGPRSGDMPSLGTLINGRQKPTPLKGPVANAGLGRAGAWYLVAAGIAYHAGAGSHPGVSSGNGNLLGVEIENIGYASEPFTAKQMDALRYGCAALLKFYKLPADRLIAHKEWAPRRKIDPHDMDMGRLRAEVGEIIGGSAPPPVLIPKADPTGRPTVRRPDWNDAVKDVQRAVGVEPDGRFGPKTEAALRKFQLAHDLVPDGIAGPKSWAAIDAMKGAHT
jgi:N-acetylmuramoyl-L-alanine amidase/Putative peptidoglycan binding domain